MVKRRAEFQFQSLLRQMQAAFQFQPIHAGAVFGINRLKQRHRTAAAGFAAGLQHNGIANQALEQADLIAAVMVIAAAAVQPWVMFVAQVKAADHFGLQVVITAPDPFILPVFVGNTVGNFRLPGALADAQADTVTAAQVMQPVEGRQPVGVAEHFGAATAGAVIVLQFVAVHLKAGFQPGVGGQMPAVEQTITQPVFIVSVIVRQMAAFVIAAGNTAALAVAAALQVLQAEAGAPLMLGAGFAQLPAGVKALIVQLLLLIKRGGLQQAQSVLLTEAFMQKIQRQVPLFPVQLHVSTDALTTAFKALLLINAVAGRAGLQGIERRDPLPRAFFVGVNLQGVKLQRVPFIEQTGVVQQQGFLLFAEVLPEVAAAAAIATTATPLASFQPVFAGYPQGLVTLFVQPLGGGAFAVAQQWPAEAQLQAAVGIRIGQNHVYGAATAATGVQVGAAAAVDFNALHQAGGNLPGQQAAVEAGA